MHTIIIRHTCKRYTGTCRHHDSCAVVSECPFFNKYIPDTDHNTGCYTYKEYYRGGYDENRKYNILGYTSKKVAWSSKPGPAHTIPGSGISFDFI